MSIAETPHVIKRTRHDRYREPDAVLNTTTTTSFALPRTHGTQTTHATFHPTSGRDPYARHAHAATKQALIREELEGAWILDNGSTPSLLETFFPDPDPAEGDPFPGVSTEKYRDVVAAFHNYEGWDDWPTQFSEEQTKEKTGQRISERTIAEAFVKLVNFVVDAVGVGNARIAIDRQDHSIPTHDGGNLKPDVFLWGKGSPAFPPAADMPEATTPKDSSTIPAKRKYDAAFQSPDVDWPWCVMPIEIKTQNARGKTITTDKAYPQLGTYIREVFMAQPHRRFMPSLIVTEVEVEFLRWDRAGVLVSERIEYRRHWDLFCRMLVSFVAWGDFKLGFDPTVFYPADEGILHILTKQTVEHVVGDAVVRHTEYAEYVVEETLFRSYTLRGRGSTCWRVRKQWDDDPHARYVILDSWVKDGRDAERDIFRRLAEAGVGKGYAQMIHIDDVQFPLQAEGSQSSHGEGTNTQGKGKGAMDVDIGERANSSKPYRDSVNSNRKAERFKTEVDLTHTRTVLRCHGTPLERYTSPKELVSALLNVIEGHSKMYEAGVVHRDIVLWNILIQRNEVTGSSEGVLIDFSCASSSVEPGVIIPRPEQTPGSSWFMSATAHLNPTTTSYLDDLESFYWILYAIVSSHTVPHASPGTVLSAKMDDLITGSAAAIHEKKDNHFYGRFKLEIDACFGRPIEDLLKNLHQFFQARAVERGNVQEAMRRRNGARAPPEHTEGYRDVARKHYQTLVNYFTVAIRDLELGTSTLGDALAPA